MWSNFRYDDDIREDKHDLNGFDPVATSVNCNYLNYYRHRKRIKWYTSGFK